MNFSLKPHQLVAHWVPGFVFLLLVTILHPDLYGRVKTLLPAEQVSRGLVWVVLAFVSGQLIDCLRNGLFEWWRDKRQEVNWDFFFTGNAERLENLDRWFFEYYVFDLNLAVPALYFFVCRLFQGHWVQSACGLAAAGILIRDAWSLRGEIAKHTKSPAVPPSSESASSSG
jgi:hypothetical protein